MNTTTHTTTRRAALAAALRSPRTYLTLALVVLYAVAQYKHWDAVLAVLHVTATVSLSSAGASKVSADRTRPTRTSGKGKGRTGGKGKGRGSDRPSGRRGSTRPATRTSGKGKGRRVSTPGWLPKVELSIKVGGKD